MFKYVLILNIEIVTRNDAKDLFWMEAFNIKSSGVRIYRLTAEEIAELVTPIHRKASVEILERISVDPAFIETEIINDDG